MWNFFFSSKSSKGTPIDPRKDKRETVAVVGSSGVLGRHVAKHLVRQNYKVRALVRNPEKAKHVLRDLPADSVEIVKIDLQDVDSLTKGVKGVKAVINTTNAPTFLGLGYLWWGNVDTPYHVDYLGNKNLVRACKSVPNPPHLVLVTSMGITRPALGSSIFWNYFGGGLLRWKFRAEEVIRHSDLTYTIVRPGAMKNGQSGNAKILMKKGDILTGNIAKGDVAVICVEAVRQPTARNCTFEVINNFEEPSLESNIRDEFKWLSPDK